MKAVLILVLVGAALVLISLIRIGVQVKYDPGMFTLRARIGPVRLTILPRAKKQRKRQQKQKPEKKKPERQMGDWLGLARQVLPVVTEAAGRLKQKIRLDRIFLDVAVGAGDPARAALAFGGVNGAIGMLWPLVEQNFNVKDRRIRTKVDFSASHTAIWLDGAATLTVGQALALALWLAPRLPRLLEPEGSKQTKKQTDSVQKEAV